MKSNVYGNDLPLRSHIEELRRRLLWSLVVILAGTAAAFVFHKPIMGFLMGPAQQFAGAPGGKPVFTDLTEMVGITMKMSFLGGLGMTLPFLLYQILAFVSPGLTGRERRYLFAVLPAVLVSFVGGVAFGYYVLLPPAIGFLLNFGSDLATPLIRIGNYLNLVVSLLFWMGFAFEMPIAMLILGRLGIVDRRWLARRRRYAVVVAFLLGALITPTFDPVNQTLVALPIVGLYELGIWLAWIGSRGRRGAARSPV